MKKKRLSLLAVMCMLLITLMSVEVFAAETTYEKEFSFSMAAYAGKDQSSLETKDNSFSYATTRFVHPTSFGQDYYPLYCRVRSGTNDKAATALATWPSTEGPIQYNSGFGLQGYQYYLKMQTDSSCPYAMTASGFWKP